MQPRVEVLLACYQGESFLEEQLDSIFRQSFQHFKLIARDDCSTDGTLCILQTYQKRFPERLEIVPAKERLGVIGNFNVLLENSSADIIFFSDQDDVWDDNKIELSLEAMKGVEGALLLHTDLQVVDERRGLLQPSFLKYSSIDPILGRAFNRLLVQNMVTGCTVAINRKLKELVYPFPNTVIMHDWWMALVACVCGRFIFLSEKTVNYRQHSSNVIGARHSSLLLALRKLRTFMTSFEANTKDADLRQKQAKALYDRCCNKMSSKDRALLLDFLKGPKLPLFERKWECLRHGFYRQGWKKMFPYLIQNRPY